MTLFNIIAVAIALAMDAFAVSIAVGVNLKKVNHRQKFRLAWHFGLFQAMMPVIGWLAGSTIKDYVKAYDHWVAFALLALVGVHMIKEALGDDDPEKEKNDPTKGLTMVMLSIATSIDALAIGFSLSLLNLGVIFPAVVIGVVALLFTLIGLLIGEKAGSSKKLALAAEIMGGVVLLAIGINILFEHGVFDFL
jgi:putative Mn2+ efflux pump MntP